MFSGFENRAPLLPEILALHGKWRGERDALIFEDQRINWRDFCAANHRFAHGLIAAGVHPGDRVGVVMSNSPAMVQALFGIMAAGAVSVPINLSVPDAALLAMLQDAEAVAVVATEDQCPRLDALSPKLGSQLRLRLRSGDSDGDWLGLEQLCAGQAETLPDLFIADNAYLNVIYSSGTTGLPKGIVHSHAGRRDWAYDLAIALRYNCSARTLLTIGLYSNISWVAMLATVLAGGSLVVHRAFEAAEFLRCVETEKITHTAMVPIQFQRVLDAQATQPRALDSMQAMMSCGSPLHEGLKKQIFEVFPCGIIELYGLTEGIITTLEPEEAQGRWSSVGKPLIGTDIAIVGDNDEMLPPGSAGEVVSRGRISMPGYLNREQANIEAQYIDADGRQWLRSGDIGQLDDLGYLYIVDRKKDMILSGGQNVYPQDIEGVLVAHPAVDEVAVIGAASSRWGETPVALVVAKTDAESGRDFSAEQLLAWANAQLGRQQRLADLLFIDALPRNPNGKILKRELRQQFSRLRYD